MQSTESHDLARRRRSRHLVFLRALAVLYPWLAGRDAGAKAPLSDERARHRLRHHLLLGCPDDDDGPAFHARGSLPRCLYPRPRPRREGRQDVEVEGQCGRSLAPHRNLWRGCPALYARRHGGAGTRHQAIDATHRGISKFWHKTLERGAFRRNERLRAARGHV